MLILRPEERLARFATISPDTYAGMGPIGSHSYREAERQTGGRDRMAPQLIHITHGRQSPSIVSGATLKYASPLAG